MRVNFSDQAKTLKVNPKMLYSNEYLPGEKGFHLFSPKDQMCDFNEK